MKRTKRFVVSILALSVVLSGFTVLPLVFHNGIAAAKDKGKPVSSGKLRVMSYNLRYASDVPPNSWEERRPVMRKLLQRKRPDVIGTQEGVYHQLKHIHQDLPGYEWIGLGREGGSKGEFMAVFYNANRLQPQEYDHYWLSDTPEVIGSTSWGNTIPRMVTWVRFLDVKTKKEFYLVNTHFDHVSEEAREKSARLIVERALDFDPELPIVLTGDFNTGPSTAPYETLVNDGSFVDLWESADKRIGEGLGTFNGFEDVTGGGAEQRIDWIMARGSVTAKTIEISNFQRHGQFPSDHFPVVADIKMR